MNTSRCTRSISWLLASLCGILMWCGCSPAGDPALIGKWQSKDGKEIIQFHANGKVDTGEKDPDITSSKWAWIGTNEIRLTLKHKVVGTASGTMKVTVNGDSLILKDEDGPAEYTRVK